MKLYCYLFFAMLALKSTAQTPALTENVFFITADGLRWQEVFSGADSALLHSPSCTADTALANMLYWQHTPEERRKKLMPFVWNVIGRKGQLYGNRYHQNYVNMANAYKISYPGYNELLTGTTDLFIFSNKKVKNKNTNLLAYLNTQEPYKGRVAAFSSWDVLPFVLNEEKSNIPVNGGYENISTDSLTPAEAYLNTLQEKVIADKEPTRFDMLTLVAAKAYIKSKQPKVVFIGMGETDEHAHHGRYDLYLQAAAQFDNAIAELWYYVQTTEQYRNKTTFIITTDHGRGNDAAGWKVHGPLTKGSGNTWMAIIGPDTAPLGELREPNQLYGKQMAPAIVHLLGVDARAPNKLASGGFAIEGTE